MVAFMRAGHGPQATVAGPIRRLTCGWWTRQRPAHHVHVGICGCVECRQRHEQRQQDGTAEGERHVMQKKALHDGCILGGERFAIVAGTLPNATDTGCR
jgi:hypothetical protein